MDGAGLFGLIEMTRLEPETGKLRVTILLISFVLTRKASIIINLFISRFRSKKLLDQLEAKKICISMMKSDFGA